MMRSTEVAFARLQQLARDAARRGDWNGVEEQLNAARELAEGNSWLAAALSTLEAYAHGRNEEQFAKEAHYQSSRMMSRVADAGEASVMFSIAEESSKPRFLRRKIEEGRGRG